MSRMNAFTSGTGKPAKPKKEDKAWYETVRDDFNATDKGAVARYLTGGDTTKDNDTWMPDWLDERAPQELVDTAKGIGQAVNFGSNMAQGIFYGAKDLGQWSLSQLTKNPFDPNSQYNASGLVDNPYSSDPSGKGNDWDNWQRPLIDAALLAGPTGFSNAAKATKALASESAAAVKSGVKAGAKKAVKTVDDTRTPSAPTATVDLSRSKIDPMGEERALIRDAKSAETKSAYPRDVTPPTRTPRNEGSDLATRAKKAVAGAMIGLSAMSPTASALAKDVSAVVKTVDDIPVFKGKSDLPVPAGSVKVKSGDTLEQTLAQTGKNTSSYANVNHNINKAKASEGAPRDLSSSETPTDVSVPMPVTVPTTQTTTQQQQEQQQQTSSSDTTRDGALKPKPGDRIKPLDKPDAAAMKFSGDETEVPLTA